MNFFQASGTQNNTAIVSKSCDSTVEPICKVILDGIEDQLETVLVYSHFGSLLINRDEVSRFVDLRLLRLGHRDGVLLRDRPVQ